MLFSIPNRLENNKTMKKLPLCAGLCLAATCFFTSNSQAQLFKKLKDKVSDKIENKVDKVLDGDLGTKSQKDNNASAENKVTANIGLSGPYLFVQGKDTIYFDNFSADQTGAMASHWKSNGSGSIETTTQFPGKWLFLNEFTSYKLKSDTPLPDNFTIEFDIVTLSRDKARDLNSLSFGFAHDNGISSYIGDAYNEGAICQTEIHYWNKEIINSSSDNKKYNTIKFPLKGYAIGKMHVAITVKGLHMQVYLDKHKVLDTDMFASTPETKYFYISTSTRLDNGAKIGVGNFKIAGL